MPKIKCRNCKKELIYDCISDINRGIIMQESGIPISIGLILAATILGALILVGLIVAAVLTV